MIRSCIDLLIGLDLSGINPTKVAIYIHMILSISLPISFSSEFLPSQLHFSQFHYSTFTFATSFTVSTPGADHFQGVSDDSGGHDQV